VRSETIRNETPILSILIPVFNEEGTIEELIRRVKLADIGEVAKNIIVVDDGSTDSTRQILESVQDVKVVLHKKNQGKGVAVRTGIAVASGDIIIIQDGDLEYDPNDYKLVIGPILGEKSDVVYGSRRLKKTNQQHSALRFYFGGVFLTFLTNLLYPGAGLTDEPTCYKAFRSSLLKSIELNCQRFEFCPEVTAKVLKRGIKIVEVPISYYPRSVNEGKKIGWRDGLKAIWTLVRYRF
jgi:dolichol-phosphate mannosyltransferase